MKKIYLSITMLFAVCAANAADVVFPAPAKAVKLDAPWGIAPSQTITVTNVAGHKPFYIPDTGEKIIWSATAKELFIDGGVPFSLSGRKYVVKHVRPFNEIIDITDFDKGKIMVSQPLGIWAFDKVCFPDATLTLDDSGNKLTISDSSNAPIVFNEGDIFQAWLDNANRYCAQHFGENVCLVPQALWNDTGDNTGHVGFIIAPVDEITMDLEFMRLFEYKSGGDLIPYAPINYSVFAATTIYYTGKYTGNSSEFLLTEMNERDYWIARAHLMESKSPYDESILSQFDNQYLDK